jgi:hypothetical protein
MNDFPGQLNPGLRITGHNLTMQYQLLIYEDCYEWNIIIIITTTTTTTTTESKYKYFMLSGILFTTSSPVWGRKKSRTADKGAF